MAAIEMEAFDVTLGDGAAVRLSEEAPQGGVVADETHVYFEPCEESKLVSINDACDNETGAGRMLDVQLKLRHICPGRRVAVGVALSEVDNAGNEYSRGFRAFTVPAQTGSGCEVVLPRIRFILPEDLRADGDAGMCRGRRHFIIRTSNHYVDSTAVL